MDATETMSARAARAFSPGMFLVLERSVPTFDERLNRAQPIEHGAAIMLASWPEAASFSRTRELVTFVVGCQLARAHADWIELACCETGPCCDEQEPCHAAPADGSLGIEERSGETKRMLPGVMIVLNGPFVLASHEPALEAGSTLLIMGVGTGSQPWIKGSVFALVGRKLIEIKSKTIVGAPLKRVVMFR